MHDADATPELIARETERLLGTARALTDDDVRGPSLCPGWSRGHVLTHVARNADGLARVTRAVVTGTDETMYAAGDARDADIVAGSGRSAAELAEDVRVSADALAPWLTRLGPEHAGRSVPRTPAGRTIAAEDVRYLRLREVIYHHVDLDAGFTFRDVEPRLVGLFLDETLANLREHPDAPGLTLRTEGGEVHVIGDGAAHVSGAPAGLLAWLARGRTDEVRASEPLPTIPAGV